MAVDAARYQQEPTGFPAITADDKSVDPLAESAAACSLRGGVTLIDAAGPGTHATHGNRAFVAEALRARRTTA